MSDRPYDVKVDEGVAVRLPSGALFWVLTQDEADYFEERARRYLSDNHFVNVSDFQDIDKMVTFELFIHRWSLWLSRGVDYYNEAVDQRRLADQVERYSGELRLLKKNLGMDKPARDRQRGDDSWAAYLDALKQRAREFGYMRNEQFAHVITAFQRLKGILAFHDNCTDEERRENHVTLDDVFAVLRDEIAAFDRIDEKFRTEKQVLWIRKQ